MSHDLASCQPPDRRRSYRAPNIHGHECDSVAGWGTDRSRWRVPEKPPRAAFTHREEGAAGLHQEGSECVRVPEVDQRQELPY